MHTIYGGKTKNNIIVSDMVNNNDDEVYVNSNFEGYFARFAQSLLREDDTDFESSGPAIIIFHESDPFEPIWGVRLTGTWSDYADEDNMLDAFEKELENAWNSFNSFINAEHKGGKNNG